jgi:malonyl-CoA O-methyltransferase
MSEAAVRDNFAAAARAYDRHASVQRASATELMEFTLPCRAESIFEPGCGTGIYTSRLLEAFPDADIRCVDIAADMIEVAREKCGDRAEFHHADAEDVRTGQYDLISSNAVFQWFTDLEGTLRRYRAILRPGGRLTFSFYGPRTYRELDRALRSATGGEMRVAAADFAGADRIRRVLGGTFARWSVEETEYVRSFDSLRELLRAIKYTGTRGADHSLPGAWTPHTLARTREAYRRFCGDIRATYQVFLCRGEL